MKNLLMKLLSAFSLLMLFGFSAQADEVGNAVPWQINFQQAATPVMEKLIGLHNYLMVIVALVVAFVTALLIYVGVKFHHSNNATPSKTTHNTMIEVIWTIIPTMILISIFIPSIKIHYYMDKAVAPDMTIKVTGHQWYWEYEYPDNGGFSYLSNIKEKKDLRAGDVHLLSVDNPVVVPVGAKVRILLSAADVIHSWAVPSFGLKVDAVPGRLNETWFQVKKPGVYYGQCSELCGIKHGFMPIEIHAVEQSVFDAWAISAKAGKVSFNAENNSK